MLVVDDDPEFRALAVQMLARLGLSVVCEAATVDAATRAARKLKPQAALVDVGLPDGDGVTLAGALAALPWRPRIVLTSTDPNGDPRVGCAVRRCRCVHREARSIA